MNIYKTTMRFMRRLKFYYLGFFGKLKKVEDFKKPALIYFNDENILFIDGFYF